MRYPAIARSRPAPLALVQAPAAFMVAVVAIVATANGEWYQSCEDVSTSGVFTIHPNGVAAHTVYCDAETDGGGWMLTCEPPPSFAPAHTHLGPTIPRSYQNNQPSVRITSPKDELKCVHVQAPPLSSPRPVPRLWGPSSAAVVAVAMPLCAWYGPPCTPPMLPPPPPTLWPPRGSIISNGLDCGVGMVRVVVRVVVRVEVSVVVGLVVGVVVGVPCFGVKAPWAHRSHPNPPPDHPRPAVRRERSVLAGQRRSQPRVNRVGG